MENLSYSSYPDSANSSPHSRDVDETQSFDEPPSSIANIHNYKVKFMCSYGGKIQPRSHDNQLSYVGGDTKILAVERNIKFSLFITKVTSLCNTDADHVCFKYQLPGEDLDALISVTNDEDLEHMMLEYDRVYRASAKPARLRLFLFHLNPTTSFGSDDVKSERQWFVDALNSVPVQNLEAAPHPPAVVSAGNADFLFGSDKVFSALPMTAKEISGSDENQQMPDLQALRIAATDEQDLNRKFEEANSRVYGVEQYQQQKVVGRIASPPPGAQVSMPVMMQVPAHFLQERHVIPGNEQTLYQIPYHQTPTLRPVTGQVGQGYYGIQQPVYNMAPPSTAAVASLPQQQTQKVGVYSEGIGMVQQNVGVAEQGRYLQVGYDSAGRQVYYTTAPAVSGHGCGSTSDGAGGWVG